MGGTTETADRDIVSGADGRGADENGGTAHGGGPDRRDPGRLSSPVLVGRERELELLVEAATSPPALIMVEGEAGVGKTRLVQEALSDPSVRSRRVLVGHCHRLREPFLLGPVVEALRSAEPPDQPLSPVVGVLQPLLPELADALPAEPAPIGDVKAGRHRVFRALRELINAFGPTVCLLEDLHWADEGTLEFLAFLLSEPPDGLSIVLTYRTEDLPASSPLFGLPSYLPRETLELGPLSLDEVRTLICARLNASAVSEHVAERLYDRTAGIPLALEEVIRLLLDRGQLTLTDDGQAVGDLEQVDVPTVIRQAIRERMESFTADARLITQAAAVLALPAGEHLLTRVAGLASTRAMRGLTRALSSALVEEKGAGLYGFRHALAAQAVYDEVPAPERRRLHQRAGEALESAPEAAPAAQLAHHFQRADRPKQWARYAEAAADGAGAVGDDRGATRFFEQALAAPGLSRAARIRVAIKLGSCARHSDCPEKVIGLLQRILEEEPMAVGVRGELRFRLAQLRYYVGDGGLWHEEMVRAAGELRRRPELAARAMTQLAWPMLREGDVADDLAWLQRAVQAAEETDDPMTKAGIAAQRAAILLCVGDPAGWAALDDIPPEGKSVENRLQLLRGYQSLSMVVRPLGYYRRSESFLAEAIRIERALDHVWWDPWRESARVALDWCLGRWEGLEPR
ncbi:MAG: AAA family ATPase, partial [Thermoleophilaceae bacterium]|nr:AAA family ATPase [Thermoleophilaceae bacterium]